MNCKRLRQRQRRNKRAKQQRRQRPPKEKKYGTLLEEVRYDHKSGGWGIAAGTRVEIYREDGQDGRLVVVGPGFCYSSNTAEPRQPNDHVVLSVRPEKVKHE